MRNSIILQVEISFFSLCSPYLIIFFFYERPRDVSGRASHFNFELPVSPTCGAHVSVWRWRHGELKDTHGIRDALESYLKSDYLLLCFD
jgi:hypothetical protein